MSTHDSTASHSPRPDGRITRLYALGSNGNFQLGLPHDEDVDMPQRCLFNVVQRAVEPLDCGSLSGGPARGLTPTETYVPLHPAESILTVAAGGNHTLFLTSHGRVFAAGSNEYGQLGLEAPCSASASVNRTSTVLAGFQHLPWTGLGSHTISHIACTFTGTYLVSSHTTLYTVGHGPKGELGLGQGVTVANFPTPVFDVRDVEGDGGRIAQVVGCMDHALILSSAGKVYGVGAGRKGQIGAALQGQGGCWVVRETLMSDGLDWKVEQIATGREFNTLGGIDGEIAIFGKGLENLRKLSADNQRVLVGCEPNPGRDKFNSESTSPADKVSARVRIYAGWSSLTVQHPTGKLTGFLANPARPTHDRGQVPPSHLPGASQVAVGSEHSVALLEDRTVVAWGWGEHGNCGSPLDVRGVVSGGRWNVLSIPETRGNSSRVVGVGAGCGSSFFWVEEAEEAIGMDGKWQLV